MLNNKDLLFWLFFLVNSIHIQQYLTPLMKKMVEERGTIDLTMSLMAPSQVHTSGLLPLGNWRRVITLARKGKRTPHHQVLVT